MESSFRGPRRSPRQLRSGRCHSYICRSCGIPFPRAMPIPAPRKHSSTKGPASGRYESIRRNSVRIHWEEQPRLRWPLLPAGWWQKATSLESSVKTCDLLSGEPAFGSKEAEFPAPASDFSNLQHNQAPIFQHRLLERFLFRESTNASRRMNQHQHRIPGRNR